MPGQLMAPGCGGQAWVPKPVAEVPSAVREAPVLAPPAPQAPWLSLPTELGPWDHVAASSLSFFFFSEGQGNLGGLIGRLPPLLLLPPATRLAALAWLLGPAEHGLRPAGLIPNLTTRLGFSENQDTQTLTTTTTQTKVHCKPPFGLLLVGALKLHC